MTLEAFAAIPRKKRIVKRQTFILRNEPITVLTEWDGRDMSHGDAPMPCPFSTCVLSDSYPNMMMAVPDEKKARVSHEMMAGFVRAQGGRGGLAVAAYFLLHMWGNPRSVKMAWTNVALAAFVVLLQLQVLTVDAITGSWNWYAILPAAAAGLYALFLRNSLVALRRKLGERREERRIEKEKVEFEKIVRQIES